MSDPQPPTDQLEKMQVTEAAAPAKTESKKKKGGGKKEKTPPKPEREWTPEMETDFQRILTVGEECISPEELKKLITAKGRGSEHPVGFNLYDGFEPSGRMHIAQGVFKAMNVNKCTEEGTNSTFTFWVADWFALMNDKMGGDLEKIKIVGKYLIEVWKAAGMNLDHVVFKWASEEITDKADIYWPTMLDVARRFNVTRIKKCCQIMGRLEGNLTSAQVLYPLMQCTDVFFLKADICQLGVDQRKVNMLAREYCDAAKIKNKPIILSHHMLYGLKAGQEKMSKSDPDSAVFMEDTAADVERKIMAAYCPDKEEEVKEESKEETDAGKESMQLTKDTLKNPCLDYIKNIILCPPGSTFTVNGTTYSEFEPIKADFLAGKISGDELKKGLIDALNNLLEPVRDHFTNDENAKDLLEKVKQYKREGNTKVSEKKIRRLDLVSQGKVDAGCHAVFAPLPSSNPALEEALSTLSCLKAGEEGKSKVLMLPDWTGRVCNSCDADLKAINAFYTIFIAALNALDSDLMKSVVIMKQSDAILADPSNYWISVINVGRHFSLDDVMGSNMQDSEGVGIVIGRLMKIADVMGLTPSSIGFTGSEDNTIEKGLIDRYFDEKLETMSKPSFAVVETPSLVLQDIEDEAHKTENYEYFILDDPKVNGKSKMKKAFCEPGNIEFCPPIVLANAFAAGDIEIKRSEENGGDVIYKEQADMEADFKSGALHPGDLKATASTIMVGVLDKIASAIKADKEATQASKALKAFAKKMAKKKK
ncbi:nucleotidylyl transferase [Chaetoceros tenuissimus]|uniref:tyrosine--tRNA ligase n=1 Tax=Chaetoceros tenuissimus TaxID=426638 RepID=A0AAD3D650_9STRA|nr:nucleotidylyl transferase [Chaetoceros tenuissimus]